MPPGYCTLLQRVPLGLLHLRSAASAAQRPLRARNHTRAPHRTAGRAHAATGSFSRSPGTWACCAGGLASRDRDGQTDATREVEMASDLPMAQRNASPIFRSRRMHCTGERHRGTWHLAGAQGTRGALTIHSQPEWCARDTVQSCSSVCPGSRLSVTLPGASATAPPPTNRTLMATDVERRHCSRGTSAARGLIGAQAAPLSHQSRLE